MPLPALSTIATTTVGDQALPDSAWLGLAASELVVVWIGEAPEGGWGIYARRLGQALLDPIGGEIRVDQASEPTACGFHGCSARRGPRVAAFSGGFVVVWEGKLPGVSVSTIFGRWYGLDGTPIGDEALLDSDVAWNEQTPDVGADRFVEEVVVVWSEPDGSGSGISARRFASDGTPIGDSFQVNSTTAGEQEAPTVAAGIEGDFTVVWEGPDADARGIFAQRFGPSGGAIFGEFQVNESTTGDQAEPSVAVASGGSDLVVVWSIGPWSAPRGIFARRFSGVTPLGPDRRVDETIVGGPPVSPAVDAQLSGPFAVAWDMGLGLDLEEILARRFLANGNPVENEFRVNSFTHGSQRAPTVLLQADGSLITIWQSDLVDGSGTGLYAARMPPVPQFNLGEEPREPALGTGFTFASGPRALLALETSATGASGQHRMSLELIAGDLELYSATWAYPAGFLFEGFLAAGPIGSVVGIYRFDTDGDGQGEIDSDLVSLDDHSAYLDTNGDRDPTGKPWLLSSVGPGLAFALFAPFGGDGDPMTLTAPEGGHASLELASGLITNPIQAGTYAVEVLLSSVDPDNDDADDGVGEPPLEVYSRTLVAILAPSALFADGFETGDTSLWSSTVP